MSTVTARFRTIAGTEAALGMVEGRSVIADRPEGKAGGLGLGYSGSQLLALAIGTCFHNTLLKQAHQMKTPLAHVEIDVTLAMDGDPLTATRAVMKLCCQTADGATAYDVIARARNTGMVSRSVAFPVELEIVG